MKKFGFIERIFDTRLQNVIFFVTSVCNSRCIGCFNWQNLNQKDDLTLEEIDKFTKTMPHFNHVLFSGGEPFLRKDLLAICRIFKKNNKIKSISIPSNGILTNKIKETTEQILKEIPSLGVGIHFSLDGLKETHEKVRGVPRSFEKVVESIKDIVELKTKYPQLDVTVNTVISNLNYKELGKLVDVVKGLDVDDHTFDLLRGMVKDKGEISLPAIEEIKKLESLRKSVRKYYLRKEGFVHRLFSLSKENYLLDSQRRVLCGKRLKFRCLAGNVSAVITHKGEVGLCELLPLIGALRKEGYNFGKIWQSEKAQVQRKQIANHKCDCTHTCFLSMSIDHSPLDVFIKMPLKYIFKNGK